ncbi:MAG: phosphoglycerate mutase family protein [bacterium]
MQNQQYIENILRINPDIVYTSPSLRTRQTAEEVAKIMKTYRDKKIKIKIDERLRVEEKTDLTGIYKEILKKRK